MLILLLAVKVRARQYTDQAVNTRLIAVKSYFGKKFNDSNKYIYF